jgi:hypothetical protein
MCGLLEAEYISQTIFWGGGLTKLSDAKNSSRKQIRVFLLFVCYAHLPLRSVRIIACNIDLTSPSVMHTLTLTLLFATSHCHHCNQKYFDER